MGISLTLALGAVAILATIPSLTFIIMFAVVLTRDRLQMSSLAIVASSLDVLSLVSIMALILLQFRHRIYDPKNEQRVWRPASLTLMSCFLCLVSIAAGFATLSWMQIQSADLPQITCGAHSKSLLIAAFVVRGLSSLAQAFFLLTLLRAGRSSSLQIQSLHADGGSHNSSEMQQASHPQRSPQSRGRQSSDSQSVSSKGRKRSGSDTMNSIRSSITHVVRPNSSKTRLLSQKQSYRTKSLDSGTGEREIVEEGFDSWDTSAVDPQSRQFVMSATNSIHNSSPNGGRLLETIPASPTGSRSTSPGFPLDLEPPSRRRRSRSHSPATSFLEFRSPTTTSPTGGGSESHIHPLFRSDSPTPPPTATPGTIVTAAPNAGQLISDRRSIPRMRSASLPSSSPLGHSSNSLDDDLGSMGEDNDDDDGETVRAPSPPEREMTPPIPDWVLGAGPRSSLTGYTRRKGGGLGPVRES